MTRKLIETLKLPFESVRTFAEAGMSEVHLYENEVTGAQQIGKRVGAFGNEQAVVFLEAKLLQKIRHDHVVPVHDVAVVENAPEVDRQMKLIEMIMPYYPRGSVYDALGRGERFSVGEAVRLTREALAGLNELHEQHRILHRDVKSANVFLSHDGRLLVGDLGIAIPMEDDGTAEAYPSSQMYTAPEVAATRRCARHTDIYGIGLILLELLNGPFNYAGYDRSSITKRLDVGKRAIRNADLVPKPYVSPRLRSIVKKAISIDPAERFPDACAISDALDKAPFIDWRVREEASEFLAWEGRLGGSTDRYRVEARKFRRQPGWRLSGLKFVTRWQRCVDNQDVAEPLGKESRKLFDQVLKLALSR